MEDHSTLAPLALQQLQRSVEAAAKLLTIEALTASYLLAEAQDTDLREAEIRELGAGTAAVVARLSELLAGQLPAPVLVDSARTALGDLLAGLPQLRTTDPGGPHDGAPNAGAADDGAPDDAAPNAGGPDDGEGES